MQQLELYKTIAAQYLKHDFKLEQCLMTAETLSELKGSQADQTSFLGAAVEPGAVDAIWFSRPSAGNTRAWELRLVSATPVSLLEKIPDSTSALERQAKLKEIEGRLLELIGRRREAIEEIVADAATRAPDERDEDDEDAEPSQNGDSGGH